jgi:outer membrane receptor protein involved in Fe transport
MYKKPTAMNAGQWQTRLFGILLMGISSALIASGQDSTNSSSTTQNLPPAVLAPTPPSTASVPSDNGTIQLDPFEVTTDKDIGYLANSTLSGTLFNTELKDTPASISVITSEFIKDLGAFNIKDVMLYANNTAPDLDEGTAGGNPPNGNFLSGTYNQFRVRGSDISQSVDYFITDNIPVDMYNIERVEESRGPNSVLFGIGSPSGVLNYSTKQAIIGKSIGDVSLTTGSYGTIRGTIDLNRSFYNNKMALRLDLNSYHDGAYRLFDDADGSMGSAAFTYRPTSKIELRARIEFGSTQDEGPRNDPMTDEGVEEWMALGKPLFNNGTDIGAPFNYPGSNWFRYGDPGTYDVPYNLTAVSHPGQNTPQLENFAGQIYYNLSYNPIITDKSIVSPTVNGLGPEAKRHARWETNTITSDIQLLPRLFLQASFNHLQTATKAWNNPGDDELQVDVNAQLPDGSPNPDAGRLFIQGNAQTYEDRQLFDRGRLLLSGEQDLGKWFGHYHAAISVEQDDDSIYNVSENEVWAGAQFGQAPNTVQVSRRTYLNAGQWDTYYMVSPGDNNAFVKNLTDPSSGQTFSTTMAPASISSERSQQRDLMGILQATYLDDLLAVNAGARRDTLTQSSRGLKVDTTTGILEEDPSSIHSSGEGGNTTSVGAVLHLIKYKDFDFDVLADKSDNFGLPNPGLYDLTGKATGDTTQPLPASIGTGNEWGFAVTLLKGMFYLKAVHFEDATIGLYNYIDDDAIGPKNEIILQALVDQGSISQATADERSTLAANVAPYNQTDNGNEISLTANMTKNWRLQVNFSENNAVAGGVEPVEIDFWNKVLIPYYSQFPENIPSNADPYRQNSTITQLIAAANSEITYNTAVEGKGLIGFRKYKWNFFSRYTFEQPMLKGLFVGGGYVFQSQMTIGAYPDGSTMFGGKTGTGSALLGYETKIGRFPVRFQLNVLNVFNNTAPIIYRRAIDGAYYLPGKTDYLLPLSLIYPDPRSWRLSADLSF